MGIRSMLIAPEGFGGSAIPVDNHFVHELFPLMGYMFSLKNSE